MAHASETCLTNWTAADLVHRFGPIPLHRVRIDPAPGTATDRDLVAIHAREGRLYELVDGVLVEKTVGAYESYLALLMGQFLGVYIRQHNLGILMGADGMLRLAPDLVRIPDMSFISWDRLPERQVPRTPIVDLAPDLAVEVISKSNTAEEMDRKLHEYLAASVRLAWYVYPLQREVHAYTSLEQRTVLRAQETLTADSLLPGFSLSLQELFAEPGQRPTGVTS